MPFLTYSVSLAYLVYHIIKIKSRRFIDIYKIKLINNTSRAKDYLCNFPNFRLFFGNIIDVFYNATSLEVIYCKRV